jgi:hypothetical protein
MRSVVDAAAPPAVVAPQPPAAHFSAPTDIHPRTPEERELCERASRPDWIYLAGLLSLDVASILVHPTLKQNESPAIRTLGAGFIGFSWGATLGGGALTLPACDPNWVWSAPPEGDVRSGWPLTLALSLVATTTAPFIVGVVTGPLPGTWTYTERSTRLYFAGGAALLGSLLPHIPVPILSPVPFRAARELENLRFAPMEGGGAMGLYTTRF